MMEVKDKIDELYLDEEDQEQTFNSKRPLLETILIPEELEELQNNLPKANYTCENPDIIKEFFEKDLPPVIKSSKPDSSRKTRSRKTNSQRKVLREVFSYGAEKTKSKESNRNKNNHCKFINHNKIAKVKIHAKERREISESVKNIKKAILKQRKRIENSQSNVSIPLSYMNNVKRIKNM